MSSIEAALKDALTIDGAIGAAIVDAESGMALGTLGATPDLDLSLAAAGSTEMVRATRRCLDLLGMHDQGLEDTLTTLTGQYHLIRPLTRPSGQGLFLYLALDRARANLAMARHHARRIDTELEM